jgi:hypothetical protein
MSKLPRLRKTAEPDRDGQSDAGYAVGYGRPPTHSRFKPGQSGNRKGRPKRHRNFRTVVIETLNESIKIRRGGRLCSIPMSEALVRTITTGERANGSDRGWIGSVAPPSG